MIDGNRNTRTNENTLTKDDRCDCFFLSKPLNPADGPCPHSRNLNYCYHVKNFQKSTSKTANLKENIVSIPQCQSNVKITVQTKNSKSDETESSLSSSTSTFGRHQIHTGFSMKQICFRLCNKNKNSKDEKKNDKHAANESTAVPKEKTCSPNLKNETLEMNNESVVNKTSKIIIIENKDNNELPDKTKQPEDQLAIEELIKKYCCQCPKPPEGVGGAGYNTNTIIFPANKSSGNNFSQLEDFIKTEMRNSDRKIEDIFNELQKQRREIREVKDVLEILAQTVKNQLFMKNGKNSYVDIFFDDLYKKNCKLSQTYTTGSRSSNHFRTAQIT